MRRHRPSPEHADAVARRLATLSAELAALRTDAGPGGGLPAADGAPGPSSASTSDGPTWAGLTPVPDPPAVHPPGVVAAPAFVPDVDGHTRIRGAVPLAAVEPPAPVVVRAPGRHAHRRGPAGATVGRRWTMGPAHLAVVLTVLLVGLLGTTWVLLAGRGVEQTPPVAGEEPVSFVPVEPQGASADAAEAGAATGEAGAGEAAATVTVDVAGKVRRPGIAVLPVGSRVTDAIESAGGARRGVDLSNLNLARVLVDGEQVLVGSSAAPGTSAAPAPSGATGALVNINTADQVTLETLPGVGPVTAAAIIGWRTDNGSFTAVDELVEVDGIGEATLAKLAPLVTV
ncbi:MAG: helix-hairpin-helix domain-containing protein [Nocardioides sp.]|uniref:helix-hairpin-helix domain-containing protein n=1 Tax=Nocardioides sp. TaxID=35761 RepID=UPI003EFCF012